jgi:spermidine synthase
MVLPALGMIAALPFAPEAVWPKGTVWVSESAYNNVRVVGDGSRLLLVLNEEGSVHTIRDEATGWTGRYYDDFALGPLLIEVEPRRLLVLGMGGGASIASTRAVVPNIEIDAVEIDQKVVEAGVRFFGLKTDDQRLHIHVADARPWLMHNRESYQLVHLDLYQGGPYVPFYLITVEFFQLARAHMSEDGLLMMNVFDISETHELLHATAATLRRVFPSLMVLPSGHGNYLVFAFTREHFAASLRAQLARLEPREAIKLLARKASLSLTDLVPPFGSTVFTDDHAPVEEMTRRMLAKYRFRAR